MAGFKIGNPGDDCGCDCVGGTCPSSHTLTITTTDCNGVTPANGAVVSVTGPGGYSASCTANSSGVCSVTWTALGTYTISTLYGGQTTVTTKTISACFNTSTSTCMTGALVSCGNLFVACDGTSNGTIEVIQGGSTVASTTAQNIRVCVPSGINTDVTFVPISPRFTGGTVNWGVLGACSQNLGAAFAFNTANYGAVAAGYSCLGSACQIPASNTLHLTDTGLSTTSVLTYQTIGGFTGWYGTASYTVAACGGCAFPGVTYPTTVNVQYSIDPSSGLLSVAVESSASHPCPQGGTGSYHVGSTLYTITSCPPALTLTGTVVNGPCVPDSVITVTE